MWRILSPSRSPRNENASTRYYIRSTYTLPINLCMIFGYHCFWSGFPFSF